jgi:hypothetical protein
MSGPVPAADSIEAATALLQSELTQLEEQSEALQLRLQSIQAQLAVVSGRIESIRGALAALRSVPVPTVPAMDATVSTTGADTREADLPVAAPVMPAELGTSRATQRKEPKLEPDGSTVTGATPTRAERASDSRPTIAANSGERLPRKTSSESRFTDQVIEVLARDPHAVLRARDVAEALGRDKDAGSINAVRSTLDRLVGTSRAHRVGRGLYQAPPT